MTHYIDALDNASSLDALVDTYACPYCHAVVADGVVSECLGTFQECPNEITNQFETDAYVPLNFNEE